jgi:WhiB family redox-sensing transcriptional regulator
MYDQTTVYRAIQWCQECPVKAPCLEYALSRGEVHGVWGGTSERERVRLLRRRRVQLQSV